MPKNKQLIIFGTEDVARIAYVYFTEDSGYEVKAFSVDAQYIKDKELLGIPIVPFEELRLLYPPDQHDVFVAIAYGNMNKRRADTIERVKIAGYKLASFISSSARVFTKEIGENVFIGQNVIVQPFCQIQDNVFLFDGVVVAHDSIIKKHAYIAPGAVIGGSTRIGEYCVIGLNATISSLISIGASSFIGIGARISTPLKEESVVIEKQSKKISLPSSRLKGFFTNPIGRIINED